ncbi:zinc metalloprotease HtpX [Candidatus Woesearchaeota archaeon]|nr:zinc metalloprotease HtpX [Candidatus Woesearchaeota archaeon]
MYEAISANKRNSVILIILFILFISALGYFFGIYIGDIYIGVFIAAFISIIYAVIMYFTGDRMILTLSRAKPVTKQEYPHLFHTVEGLAIAAGIPTPKLYIIDDTAINAFATGRSPEHAAITVTKGCIDKLNRTELEGVIAHEMSHIKNYDIRIMMLTVIMVGIALLLSDFILRSFLWGGGRKRESGGSAGAILIVLGLVLALLTPLIAELMKLAISRKREYLADADGALLTRYPPGLADALKKIRDDNEPLVEAANKATAHLFIENPLKKKKGKVKSLFSTHPDINDRIKRLEAM